MSGIIDELKETYRKGDALIRLIFINSAVFILFKIVFLFYFFTNQQEFFPVTGWMSMPSNPGAFLFHPWTIVTYMFYHEGLLHILFNMLNLYWFGKIFLMYFDEKKLVSLYLMGGIAGGLFYVLIYNLFPHLFQQALLLGASASVIAIMIAIATYTPNLKVNMFLIGEVKMIYVGLFSVLLFVILISSDNPGGNIAHLGGALIGFLWARRFKQGRDFTTGFSRVLDSFYGLFKRKKLKVTYKRPVDDLEYNRQKVEEQKEVDRILEKISKGGYESLSKDEKDTLFRMGNK